MRSDLRNPNIAGIRSLLKDAFTADTLWRFCQERSDFRPVLFEIGRNASLAEMIDVLLEHCRTQLLLEKLIAAVQETNPNQYERYRAQLHSAEAVPPLALQIPHNLPPRTEFIGREKEKARIHEALRSRYFLISIQGIGGIGKTSLALEVAYECLHASKGNAQRKGLVTFDSFVWATSRNRELTLNALFDVIALTLDHPGIVQRTLEQKRFAVEKLLRERSCLLLVDNFETVKDEAVWDFLRCLPEPSKALITTREQLLSHVWSVSVRGLEEPESLVLIRGEGCRLDLESIALAEDKVLLDLHQATGGAPLAIKWAVGQIKQRGQSWDNVLSGLHQARGSIFEEIFVRSWDLLSVGAQRVLSVIPFFVTSASHKAIQVVSDVHNSALDAALGQLVEMSLVEAVDELELTRRYTLHPLTRALAVAKGKSDLPHVQQAFERLLEFYTQLVLPARRCFDVLYWDGALNHDGVSTLRPEWNNLKYAIDRALEEGHDVAALHLFLPIVHILNAWGFWHERLHLGRRICQVAARLQDPSEAWLWIDAIGYIHLQRQEYSKAQSAIRKGKEVARRLEATEALVLADAFETKILLAEGNPNAALQQIESIQQSAGLESGIEDEGGLRMIIAERVSGVAATLYSFLGNNDKAIEKLEFALKLRQSVGELQAPTLAQLGLRYLESGDIATAKQRLDAAVFDATQKDMAVINYGLAMVADRRGDARTAWNLCQDALDQFNRMGYVDRVQQCKDLLATLPQPLEHEANRT